MIVPKFRISLLSINQITKHNNCSMIFFPTYCVFQNLQTRMRISTGHEQQKMYYLDNENSPTRFATSFF